jgi:hypothetical protein
MCRHFCRTPTHCAQVADMTTSDPYVTLQLGAENHRTCTIAKVLCVYPSLIKTRFHRVRCWFCVQNLLSEPHFGRPKPY